jgi:hypothetical protein
MAYPTRMEGLSEERSQPNAVIKNQDDDGRHNPDDDGGGKL